MVSVVVLGAVIKERFKITNPNKVACQVAIGVRPREVAPKVQDYFCIIIFVFLNLLFVFMFLFHYY
jgi:hypothetical protein